jgi:hypothetical protein
MIKIRPLLGFVMLYYAANFPAKAAAPAGSAPKR